MIIYDLIIIGAGPAGLTAAIYAGRQGLKTLVLTKEIGGQVATTKLIENYPGFAPLAGHQLMEKFLAQAKNLGSEIKFAEVKKIEKQKEIFISQTFSEEYHGRSLILAFGLTPRNLEVAGEEHLRGKGISYCAVCDGPLYKGKTVAVVGGGSSALEAVLFLSNLAQKVYLIHRRSEFRGENILIERLKNVGKLELVLDSIVQEVKGQEKVTSLVIKNQKENKTQEILVEGVFVEIGLEAKRDLVQDLVELDERGYIKIDKNSHTSCPGIFAAGDITDTAYKQIVVAASTGAQAALEAYKYLKGKEGKLYI